MTQSKRRLSSSEPEDSEDRKRVETHHHGTESAATTTTLIREMASSEYHSDRDNNANTLFLLRPVDETPQVSELKVFTDSGYASMPRSSSLDLAALDDVRTVYSAMSTTVSNAHTFTRLVAERLYKDCLIATSKFDQRALSQALEGIVDLIRAFAVRLQSADPQRDVRRVANFTNKYCT